MKDLARQRYDEACDHDRAGREEEAIPSYEEALELGLLGKVVVDTADLRGYRRAASMYFDHIE